MREDGRMACCRGGEDLDLNLRLSVRLSFSSGLPQCRALPILPVLLRLCLCAQPLYILLSLGESAFSWCIFILDNRPGAGRPFPCLIPVYNSSLFPFLLDFLSSWPPVQFHPSHKFPSLQLLPRTLSTNRIPPSPPRTPTSCKSLTAPDLLCCLLHLSSRLSLQDNCHHFAPATHLCVARVSSANASKLC